MTTLLHPSFPSCLLLLLLTSCLLAVRYLDMIVTEGVRDTFRKRSKVMSTIRHMLEQQDFLEVETPVLESTAGWVHGC